jgi:hypothetical protein
VEKLRPEIVYSHNNPQRHNNSKLSWLNAYFPIDTPACYLHGDVYFSEEAIKTIVETPVKDTMFFCIRDVHDGRPRGVNPKGREPLAYKVNNQKLFRKAINHLFELIDNGAFKQDPISWNLYREINNLPLDYNGYGNGIFKTEGDYITIDDYSTDVDSEKDIEKIERFIKILKGEFEMIRVKAKRDFDFDRFNELKEIVRADSSNNMNGRLYKGDTFLCDKTIADYLLKYNNYTKQTGESLIEENPLEVIPVKEVEQKPKKATKRKTTKK